MLYMTSFVKVCGCGFHIFCCMYCVVYVGVSEAVLWLPFDGVHHLFVVVCGSMINPSYLLLHVLCASGGHAMSMYSGCLGDL